MNDVSKRLNQFEHSITPAILEREPNRFLEMLALYTTFAPHIHIDVCDGLLVQTLTAPYTEPGLYAEAAFPGSVLKDIDSEVHLMVQDPHNIGCLFARAGAHRIVAQWESFRSGEECSEVIASWESRGASVGLSILIPTDMDSFIAFVAREKRVSSIQVMSIDPVGMQGRPFDTRAIQRIRTLRQAFPQIEISVDGSMNAQSIPTVLHAGASRAVVGSAISKEKDPKQAYELLCSSVLKIL
ncbi:MAG: hypothetical protein RI911_929 [Candidatus Parcubacteria bacterium]|jgi:ribulose-phosphate 3-epimerase